jgi:hypothetical protein
MAYGVQVFSSSGDTWLDTSTFTGKILGQTTITGGTNGNTGTVSDFALGTPFYFCIPTSSTQGYSPVLSIASNVLSWDWGGRSGQDHFLFYGIF